MVSGDRSNKIAITFKSDRCLYSRSTWTSCSLCIDSCPGEAIQKPLGNKLPSVDYSRCMQCGQCLSACPLEAFESASFSERQLFNRIESEDAIRLHCFLPHGEYASLGAGVNTYQLGTCLAALTPGALFELSLNRVCELSTDQCQQCALFARAGQTLECNIKTASLLLADWGRSAHLQETTALFLHPTDSEIGCRKEDQRSGEETLKNGKTVLEGEQERATDENSVADDGGISYMRSSIRSLFHGARKKAHAGKKQLPLKAKKRRTPAWRMRLKDRWERRTGVAGDTYPWPVLVVDERRCKACGICMQLCPTGSIHHALGEGAFTYSFTPGTCVNCGLCIASCAAGALTRDYRSVSYPFDDLECSSRAALPCERCGLPVLESQGGSFCFLCLSEPDPHTFIDRIKKQMKRSRVHS